MIVCCQTGKKCTRNEPGCYNDHCRGPQKVIDGKAHVWVGYEWKLETIQKGHKDDSSV